LISPVSGSLQNYTLHSTLSKQDKPAGMPVPDGSVRPPFEVPEEHSAFDICLPRLASLLFSNARVVCLTLCAYTFARRF